jgi:hypothetical protein
MRAVALKSTSPRIQPKSTLSRCRFGRLGREFAP